MSPGRKRAVARFAPLWLLPGWLLLGLLSQPAAALELTGQYENLLFATRDSRKQQQITDLNRLRLKLDGENGPLRLHLAYDHELLWGGLVADPPVAAALRRSEPTWIDAEAALYRRARINWRHTLYRGWVEYDAGGVNLRLGRQRIAWGSGRIWNPTDRFNPVQPTALESAQKLGVDALRAAWNYGGNGSLIAVLAPGRAAYAASRKAALRWQDTFGEFDLAISLARIGAEHMLGVDLTGNLGDAGVRLEWMQGSLLPGNRSGSYGQLIAGIDYTWQSRTLPNGLYMALEYFYNGAAAPFATLLPAAGDRLNSRSRHLLGGMLGYDLTPLWRGELLLIVDPGHGGSFIAPSLKWSLREDLELTLLAQLPNGRGVAEFAGFEPLYALRADCYF